MWGKGTVPTVSRVSSKPLHTEAGLFKALLRGNRKLSTGITCLENKDWSQAGPATWGGCGRPYTPPSLSHGEGHGRTSCCQSQWWPAHCRSARDERPLRHARPRGEPKNETETLESPFRGRRQILKLQLQLIYWISWAQPRTATVLQTLPLF